MLVAVMPRSSANDLLFSVTAGELRFLVLLTPTFTITCATLLLQAGQPIHVVSERLGHSKVSMTMEVYAHVLPDMQREAAARLGALLHGWLSSQAAF
jgi:ABC-type phosphate transport system permease subunit